MGWRPRWFKWAREDPLYNGIHYHGSDFRKTGNHACHKKCLDLFGLYAFRNSCEIFPVWTLGIFFFSDIGRHSRLLHFFLAFQRNCYLSYIVLIIVIYRKRVLSNDKFLISPSSELEFFSKYLLCSFGFNRNLIFKTSMVFAKQRLLVSLNLHPVNSEKFLENVWKVS